MITEGSLQDFSLPDLIQILSLGNATGTLTLRSEGRHGMLYFREGQLLAACLGERWGAKAGADLFIWQIGVFDFVATLPPEMPSGETLSIDEVTRQGLIQLERWQSLCAELPDFFSPRAWVYPMQMYAENKGDLLKELGSGMAFSDLVRSSALGELDVLEELTRLYKADEVGLSCAPEEQLRQIFNRVTSELFMQFASISGVKMVDGLESQLNEQARKAHLGLRWRGGKVQDNLPDTWSKEQLLEAYRPMVTTLQEFIGKVYGESFIERVLSPVLAEVPATQRMLWAELTTLPTLN